MKCSRAQTGAIAAEPQSLNLPNFVIIEVNNKLMNFENQQIFKPLFAVAPFLFITPMRHYDVLLTKINM